MAYLPRSERRTEVLEAVIRIAAVEGFDGATVRRISAELGISAGNIHHLFGSAAQLKREAFRFFAAIEMAELDAAADQPTPMEQLQAYLSRGGIGIDEARRHIWKSAGQEADRDQEFATIWKEEAEVWLHRISDLLVVLAGGDIPAAPAFAAAWRLMSFSVGATSFSGVAEQGGDHDSVRAHIEILIARELQGLAQRPAAFLQESASTRSAV